VGPLAWAAECGSDAATSTAAAESKRVRSMESLDKP
jgi:hypothetical protein